MKKVTCDMHVAINQKIVELGDGKLADALLREYSDHEGEGDLQFSIPQIEGFPALQGGGTDGKYLYYALVKTTAEGETSTIVKLDPASGVLLAKSKELTTNHTNDITYDSVRDRLVVVHNQPRATLLSLLDPATLEVTEVVDIGMQIFCMTYNAKRNCFAVGKSGGQDFAVLDANFQKIKDCTAVCTRYTTQGMTSDDDFLYFVQAGKNVIMKYDWDGNFVEYLPIDIRKKGEPENLSFINGQLYVAYNVYLEKGLGVPEVCKMIWKQK